jgi:hypothetical protein
MKTQTGNLLIGLGVLHTIVGIIVFWEPLAAMFSAGLINSVIMSPEPLRLITEDGLHKTVAQISERMAAFWFFWTGFPWIVMGVFANWVENQVGRPVPSAFALAILVYAVSGLLILPVSGFPLLTVAAIYMVIATRKSTPAD